MGWEIENRQYLTACLDRARAALEAHADRGDEPLPVTMGDPRRVPHPPPPRPVAEWPAWEGDPGRPPVIQVLAERFELSAFEREILLLCAGMELDSTFPLLCARAAGDPRLAFPTFALALACLPAPHWDALAPEATLRSFSLVEVEPGPVLTQARLTIPARVWQLLVGVEALDERLVSHAAPLSAPVPLSASQARQAEQVALACARERAPVVQLAGGELSALLRVLRRETSIQPFALLLDCHEAEAADLARASIHRILGSFAGPLFVSTRERRPLGGRVAMTVELDPPPPHERRAFWDTALRDLGEGPWTGETVARLADQFDVDADVIHAAASRAAGQIAADGAASPEAWATALWDACRAQARPRLDDLAQRIEPHATWEDLVLPEVPTQTLRDVELFVRRRAVVDAWWGFDRRPGRGRGTAVLFAGPSGTGKTLAAEVLAHSLRLDLYRIDLAGVVSKYIGETEKNLARVFDAAARGGAVLLFDEADALFGKRTETKDSHDRYANIEVSYLLQRMETYRGLAVLTSNMKSALDPAFQRRLRFTVDFPFPDEAQREAIWRRAFPPGADLSRLDFAQLRRVNLAGGSIRNIAEHAAFLAADEPAPGGALPAIAMRHLRLALRREFDKLQQPLPSLDARGWD